ncbi:MAG: hypothetical protein IPL84_13405 [Chitinophagaceae bacterium]|nr:hypothetical protein [Chitinophagaceae bacterium]
MNEQILALKNALGDCHRTRTSICLEKTSYEVTTSGYFFIMDDRHNEPDEPVKIVSDAYEYQLTVINNQGHPICLVKTDKCLFTDAHKKCDCILFGNNKFFLVEISETGKKNAKRKDAVEQLTTTIDILLNHNIDLSGYEKKAIICFKNTNTNPTRPSSNSMREVFREKYNISLEEGEEIEF